MKANVSQRAVERVLRAVKNIGVVADRVEFKPDGTIALCFGDQVISADDALDRELADWKRLGG